MWEGEAATFARSHRLSERAARLLQCTAEHLLARKDGGGNGAGNIVAACMTCNRRRHQRKKDLPVDAYRALVQRRLHQGKWHHATLLRVFGR